MTAQFIEGIKLSERERSLLIEQMKKSGAADKRKHPRVVVEGSFALLCTMEFPGGSSAHFRVFPWDISKGGLAFFHRAYIYSGTKCTFTGNTIDGQPMSFKGDVVRCNHVAGTVHTVGVKLEMEIDPEVFVGEAAVNAVAAAQPQPPYQAEAEDCMKSIANHARELAKLAEGRAPVESIKKLLVALVQEVSNITPSTTPPTSSSSAHGH